MSKSSLLLAGLIALGLLAAIGLLNHAQPAAAQTNQFSPRYLVVANDKAFVLYDTSDSSKSWITFPTNEDKRHAWAPIKRLDTDAEVHNWKLIKRARE